MKGSYSLSALCGLFGYSRQAYYQYKPDTFSGSQREALLYQTVVTYRAQAPRIGAYKLYLICQSIFNRDNLMGRDAFFSFLRRKGLMLKPAKGKRTTNSNHLFRKYKNLIKGFTPTASSQLWVSDITYISSCEGFCYLHLVTDAYSHKIIGWVLAPTLEVRYTLEALQMAIDQTGKEDLNGLIHHSDRGIQYCCPQYVNKLKEHGISISMTEDYNPTDNAIAERVNGILKQEWLYQMDIPKDRDQAEMLIGDIIDFYNNKRPHASNDMQTPQAVHQKQGVMKKRWKKENVPKNGQNKIKTM